MYDPALGRLTAYDPVKGKYNNPLSLHPYLYCQNDSVNRIDPTGKTFWNVFSSLSAGIAVRSAAILAMVEGINRDSNRLFNIGLQMHHLIVPAMYLGAALGPALPAGGQLAINAGAAAWQGLTTGVGTAAGTTATLAREFALYAMAHPKALMYATDNVMDAMAVLSEDYSTLPHTPAGYLATLLHELNK